MRAKRWISDVLHFGLPKKVQYYPEKNKSFFLHNDQRHFLFSQPDHPNVAIGSLPTSLATVPSRMLSFRSVQDYDALVPKDMILPNGALMTPIIEMNPSSIQEAYRNIARAYLAGRFSIDAPVALNHTTHVLPIPAQDIHEISDHVRNTMKFVHLKNGTPYPPYLTWPHLGSGKIMNQIEDLLAQLVLWQVPHHDINAALEIRIAYHYAPWAHYIIIDRFWKQGNAKIESRTFSRYYESSDRHIIWGKPLEH